MGGSATSDFSNWPSGEVRTIVVVGRTGNGKSATGNSILQSKVFRSIRKSSSVTRNSELRTLLMEDGRRLNVIDTPGLLDISVEAESIAKEIVNCVDMAIDGIHAFLFVLSVLNRFSSEEEYAVNCLMELFGRKISEHMIVVFTGGDDLESLDEYLHSCPQPLKNILEMCGNRRVLFDNKTEDESKKSIQLMELLHLVNEVVDKNSGKPYTNDLFIKSQISKLKEIIDALEVQLSEEKAARRNTDEEIQKLVEKIEELRKQQVAGNDKCKIL